MVRCAVPASVRQLAEPTTDPPPSVALDCSLEIIKRLGYAAPTSIQAQAIPAIMSGRDVIGVAKTGSGKTIAFLLPLLRHIKDQRPLQAGDGPMAVVMTPTRELALQIVREAKPFCKVLNITVRALPVPARLAVLPSSR